MLMAVSLLSNPIRDERHTAMTGLKARATDDATDFGKGPQSDRRPNDGRYRGPG